MAEPTAEPDEFDARARQYLRAGAIDERWLHVAPVILGGGTPLFADGPWPSIELRPIEVESAPLATRLMNEAERSAGTRGEPRARSTNPGRSRRGAPFGRRYE